MDLILHLGAHRTGSTAFEKTLSHNSDVLRAEGTAIWPPKVLRDLDGFALVNNAHQRLAQGGDVTAQLEIDATRAGLTAALHEVEASGAKTLLLSEENMLGTMRNNLRTRSFYPTAADRLKVYADLLPIRPKRVAIGVRSYADYWRSVYIFVLRRRALSKFGPMAEALATQPLGWCDLVRAARAAFPGAGICLWTQDALNGNELDIGARVLRRDTGTQGLERFEKRANEGLMESDIPLIFKLRKRNPDLAGKALDARIKKLRIDQDEWNAPSLFTPAQEAQMAARFAQDLEAFRAGFLGAQLLAGPVAE